MRLSFKALIILPLLIVCSSVYSQAPSYIPKVHYEKFGVKEGLSDNLVTSITQDRDGFIWIGTQNGLNRFDGKAIKKYLSKDKIKHGLDEDNIVDVVIGTDDRLWVTTFQKIYFYDNKNDRFIPIKNISRPLGIVEYNEFIFTGTANGLSRFDKKRKVSEEIKIPTKDTVNFVPIKVWNDKIVVSSLEGEAKTFLVDIKTNKIKKIIDSLTFSVNTISNETAIISSKDGVYIYSTDKENTFKSDQLDGYISESLSGKSFLLTKKGIISEIQFNEKLEFSIKSKVKVPFRIINIFIDREENIWLVTQANGLIKISKNDLYAKKHSELCNWNGCNTVWNITSFNKKIWISNDSEKLYSTKDNKIIDVIDTEIIGPKVLLSEKNRLIVAGLGGLLTLTKDNKIERYDFDDIVVTAIQKHRDGYILGTLRNGVLFSDNEFKLKDKKINIKENAIIFLIHSDNNNLYLGTDAGLYKYKEEGSYWRLERQYFRSEVITVILDFKGDKFIGSLNNGIFIIPEGENPVELHTRGNKNENLAVYSATKLENIIYVATSFGIISFDIDNYDLKNLYQTGDSATGDYNAMSAFGDKSNIYFGTNSGFVEVKPQNDSPTINLNKPIFTSLKVFNKEAIIGEKIKENITHADSINLNYSDYPFTLSFSSFNYNWNPFIKYRYRLLGYNSTWEKVTSDKNELTFTKVPPGSYSLQVEAYQTGNSENKKVTSIKINISAPWWLSPIAKLLYLFIAFLIIGYVYKELMRRRLVQRRIRESEERLKLSLWGSGDEMWDWNIESGELFRSYTQKDLSFPIDGIREHGECNIHPLDIDTVKSSLESLLKGQSDYFEATYRVKNKSNQWVWLLDRAKPIGNTKGKGPARVTGTIKDVSGIKESEQRLKLFAKALENTSDGMFILDKNMKFVEVNRSCMSITGHKRAYYTGRTLNFEQYPKSYTDDVTAILSAKGSWSGEIELRHANGHIINTELALDSFVDMDSKNQFYVGVFSDITQRKKTELELRRLTNNDLLTGLPNRNNLQITLDGLISRQTPHAMVLINIDSFKKVNDSLGQDVGNYVLTQMAQFIGLALDDKTRAFRFGSDEFVIIVEGNQHIASAPKLAQSLLDRSELPITYGDKEIFIKFSIGIVNFPEDGNDLQTMLRKAGLAMSHAKGLGGNCYQFFNEELNYIAIKRIETEELIRQSIKEGWLEVYYQPKLSINSKSVIGMEALVRINHPTQGLISPGKFIDVAEETGLIVDIGDFVFNQACHDTASWNQTNNGQLRVAINLSAHQFRLSDIVTRIKKSLSDANISAESVELEITESSVIENPQHAINIMTELKSIGIKLALDDFGTGYSSLAYLKQFPLDVLKIDRSFIRDISNSEKDEMMVSSIITLANNLNMEVIAEGVETSEHLHKLSALGCDQVQGFYVSPPLPKDQFNILLNCPDDFINI